MISNSVTQSIRQAITDCAVKIREATGMVPIRTGFDYNLYGRMELRVFIVMSEIQTPIDDEEIKPLIVEKI